MNIFDYLKKLFNKYKEQSKIQVKNPKSGEIVDSLPEKSPEIPEIKPKKPVDDGLMRLSRKGKAMLVGAEGICLRPYKDSRGYWTIGIGHASTSGQPPNPAKMSPKDSITFEKAFELLDEHIKKYERGVRAALKVKVSQEKFDALVNVCYNIGVGGLTKSTFMRRLNAGESAARVGQAMMYWTKNKELTRRRREEKDLFVKGVYAGNGKAFLSETDGRGHISYRKGRTINVFDYI